VILCCKFAYAQLTRMVTMYHLSVKQTKTETKMQKAISNKSFFKDHQNLKTSEGVCFLFPALEPKDLSIASNARTIKVCFVADRAKLSINNSTQIIHFHHQFNSKSQKNIGNPDNPQLPKANFSSLIVPILRYVYTPIHLLFTCFHSCRL
jgi:hypothetical protein